MIQGIARLSPYARCTICSAPLDVPGRPWSLNCGGDCIACMADAGDPSCVEAVSAMRTGENVVKAGREIVEIYTCMVEYAASRSGATIKVESAAGIAAGHLYPHHFDALRDALPPEKGDEG